VREAVEIGARASVPVSIGARSKGAARYQGRRRRPVPEQIMHAIVNNTALKKALQPEDLTGAAVFLASSDSDLMTGQVLVVDAGMIMLG